MKSFLKTFVADESGASAAEYALILAVVGVGIGAAAFALGDSIKDAMGYAKTSVDECGGAGAGGGAPSGACIAGAD
jgi:pilus assembly protein Flp/PilA